MRFDCQYFARNFHSSFEILFQFQFHSKHSILPICESANPHREFYKYFHASTELIINIKIFFAARRQTKLIYVPNIHTTFLFCFILCCVCVSLCVEIPPNIEIKTWKFCWQLSRQIKHINRKTFA